MAAFRQEAIDRIRAQVGKGRVLCGLSGGVDSSVAAVLIHEAIGDQLTCVFVDHGLMRLDEAKEVVSMFREHYNLPLVHVDAADLFINALEGEATRRQNAKPSAACSLKCSKRKPRNLAVLISWRRAHSILT